jgi:hypothetical protein
MTIKQMAQKALDVQSAVNLSGVVRSFHEITEAMRLEHKMDTVTCNQHPVCRLFAEQIGHLTGTLYDEGRSYSDAYRYCSEMAHSAD